MSDAWDDLSDHELESLRKAEEKFKVIKQQSNPFEHLQALAKREIFKVNFSSYSGKDAGDASPLVIHADRTRLLPLISVAHTMWLPEFEEVATLVLDAETAAKRGEPESDDLEWNLQSFGLRRTPESYIVGYGENSSPLVLNKKMLLEFLSFLASSLSILEHREGRNGQTLADLEPRFLQFI